MKGLAYIWKQRWALGWVLIFLGALLGGQAENEGNTFYIDPSLPQTENSDGDYHFSSIQAAFDSDIHPYVSENDIVVLKPGTYEESVEIAVPGVLMRGEGGTSQTHIIGTVTLTEDQITLRGIHIDASNQTNGLVVQDAQATLEDVYVDHASDAGIFLDEALRATLNNVRVNNHGGAGLHAVEADELQIENSRFQANGGAGIWLQHTETVTVDNNVFTLNGVAGLHLENTNNSEFRDNVFENNTQYGLWALDSTQNMYRFGEFNNNGTFGLVLEDSTRSTIARSVFHNNGVEGTPAGGILLKGRSAENTFDDNDIRGHSNVGSAGIYLTGDVNANTFVENTLVINQVGIYLSNEEGQPETNTFERNHIESSHGAGVFSQGRNNQYLENTLTHNNGPGFSLDQAEGEKLERNQITGNSEAGVYVTHSTQVKLIDNLLIDNVNGLVAEDLQQSEFQGNHIQDNFGKGIKVLRGGALKVTGNSILGNREDGVWLENIEQSTLSKNVFLKNQEAGVQLEHSQSVEIYENGFEENEGGLAVWGGSEVTVQFNNFVNNTSFGLWAMDEENLDARYNFWGSDQGPSGVSPTMLSYDNDLVREVSIEKVFPWLPEPISLINQPSVKGWFFEQTPAQSKVHVSRAGVLIDFANVNFNKGWLTVFTPLERPDNAPPLGEEFQYFTVSSGGRLEGTVKLTVPYDADNLSEEVPVSDLRLFLWDGVAWEELPGEVDMQEHTLTGEVDANRLERATLMMAWAQQRSLTKAAWVLTQPTWIMGEALTVRLSDPDKNLNEDRQDRLVGAIEIMDPEGHSMIVLDAFETENASGVFEVQMPQDAFDWLTEDKLYQLLYVDPEAPQDRRVTEIKVMPRASFVINADAGELEDTDYDFEYRTLEGALNGTPALKPNETLYLTSGRHEGDWTIDVPGVLLAGELGTQLNGTLELAADDILVKGLTIETDNNLAVRVTGSNVEFEGVSIIGQGEVALSIEAPGFVMSHSRVEAANVGINAYYDSQFISNTMTGTPAIINHSNGVLKVERNWWGSPDGPGEDVQGLTQEDIFPWLLTPPVSSFKEEAARVKGTNWQHPTAAELLSDMGRALLELNFSRLWTDFLQLFGQGGGSLFVLSPDWSLHVGASNPSGDMIIQRDGQAPEWMSGKAERFGLWLTPKRNTKLQLVYNGDYVPTAWMLDNGEWVRLKPTLKGQGAWFVELPRLTADSPLPLWLAVSHP